MGESDISDVMFTIKGHKIGGTLGERLKETAVTAVNELPGVLVPTSRGVYYSEIFMMGSKNPIPRNELNETTQGLTEYVTKEMTKKGRYHFSQNKTCSLG